MEGMQIYLVTGAIGLVYFGAITLLKKFFRITYKIGLILPLASVLFFLAMLLFVAPQDTTGWAGLGYVIMLVLTSVITIVYIAAWMITNLVKKNKLFAN
ncbi:MAG TPA: hypothetical protein DEA51_00400 [Erysipelotrichaceae bacterium]|nr:hypothetical protein [Erysipelotrichaceae bacterium]